MSETVYILGAGFSKEADFPLGWEFKEYLDKHEFYLKNTFCDQDLVKLGDLFSDQNIEQKYVGFIEKGEQNQIELYEKGIAYLFSACVNSFCFNKQNEIQPLYTLQTSEIFFLR